MRRTLTGKIWKCLIFWLWHSVNTNAFGLLWLSRRRNNLKQRMTEKHFRKKCGGILDSPESSSGRDVVLPVYLTLLNNHFVGFLSHDPTVEPQLGPVNYWRETEEMEVSLRQGLKCGTRRSPIRRKHTLELKEDGCRGLGLPRMFIRWLRFWEEFKQQEHSAKQRLLEVKNKCQQTRTQNSAFCQYHFYYYYY